MNVGILQPVDVWLIPYWLTMLAVAIIKVRCIRRYRHDWPYNALRILVILGCLGVMRTSGFAILDVPNMPNPTTVYLQTWAVWFLALYAGVRGLIELNSNHGM